MIIRQCSWGKIDTNTFESDRKYKQLAFRTEIQYDSARYAKNFEFFIEISQGLLSTEPGLVKTPFFENWGNPWQSLEILSYPVKDF